MGSTRALLLAGAVALGAADLAQAADLPLAPPLPAYAPEPVAFSGWYIRGDVGAGIAFDPDIRSTFEETVYDNRFVHKSIDDSAIIGLGVGYAFNSWLRFDVTGEYRTPQHLHALEGYSPPPDTGLIGTAYDDYTGRVQSSVFLANAYVDLGTWYGVTPYIGGGVGAAYTIVSKLTDNGIGGIAGYGYGGYGTAPSHDKFDLAWAGMVGLSYALTQNLKLDIGYRYLDMGDAESAAIACTVPSACERQHYHLASNDIRIGLRWLINDDVPAPPLEAPIIRKD